jgi:hypothetical protein
MVEFLLPYGAPKSLPDDPEWASPLAWATRRGHDEIAKLLSSFDLEVPALVRAIGILELASATLDGSFLEMLEVAPRVRLELATLRLTG